MILTFRHFLLPLFLGGVFYTSAQQTLEKTNPATKIDYAVERNLIPGNTMGQKLESLLFWSETEKIRRFPIMQFLYPSIKVPKGKYPVKVKPGKKLIPKWEDHTTLDSYMKENHIAGIVVLQDGKKRLEVYGDNSDKNTVWTSFSMAKSVSSMLLGIALKTGEIKSLEDPLDQYIPEFKGQDYGKVTVKQLLTMTSGIAWNEDYEDHNSDVAQMYLQPCADQEAHIISYMKRLKFQHQPGTFWNYSTGETDLLGILIQKATGKTLAEYLSEKIWIPFGMEHKAYWLADECSNLNIGGSGLSAIVEDYARLGQVMLEGGRLPDGTSVFDEEWLKTATRPLYATDENGGGYGYLWWVFPDGSYTAVGIFGQMIYINPKKKLVIAQTAAWDKATSKTLTTQRMAFVRAVERAIGE